MFVVWAVCVALAVHSNVSLAVHSNVSLAVHSNVSPLSDTVHPVSTRDLVLPGRIQAIEEVAVYAQLDGYLERLLVDVGDRVQNGQVLALINSPELDQQITQAKATLAGAQANLAQARSSLRQAQVMLESARIQLAHNRTTLARWRAARDRDLVSQQDVDDRQAALNVAQSAVDIAQANVDALPASVAAAEANVVASQTTVQKLARLQPLRHVLAPFSGVVTARNGADGTPVSSGSSAGNTPLFKVAQVESLRIFVNVPQRFTTAIPPGTSVELILREHPERIFTGEIVGVAETPDPASRAFLTEIRTNNDGELLRLGMEADVKFNVARAHVGKKTS